MKKMRAIAALSAVCLGLTALASCGSKDQEADKDSVSIKFVDVENGKVPSLEGLDAKGLKLGFSIAVNDQFGALMSGALKRKADQEGATLTTIEAKENDATMISSVGQLAASGVDVIIVQPTNTQACQKVIDSANGIPVVFLNRIPSEELTGNVYYVGSDDKFAGELQGKALAEFLKKQGKKEANLVQLTGNVGAANANFRTEGAKKALEDEGLKVNYVLNDTAQWERTQANNKVQIFLGTKQNFDAVISNNDEMAIGATLAMKGAGLDLKKTPVLGIDATPDGIAAVLNDDLLMTVFQDAVGQGEGAFAVAVNVAKGKNPPRKVDIPFVKVTKENAKDFQKK